MSPEPAALQVRPVRAANGPAGAVLQRQCACGQKGSGECEGCRKKKWALQRSAAGEAPGLAPPSVREVVRAPGEPLRSPWRGFMESRFGHDFSGVRLHTDARAAESARQVEAHAYTVGRHVVFGAGRFQPESPAGRHLLAHELVHVMQQEAAGTDAPVPARTPLEIGPPQDAFERQAEALAGAAVADARPQAAPAPLVQRQPAGAPPTTEPEPPPAGELTVEMRRQIAAQLRAAMKGLGTDETSLFSALAGRTSRQIEEIRETYEAMYPGRRLADDLRDELTGGELRQLAAVAPAALTPATPQGKGDEAGKEDEEKSPENRAHAVAARLNAAMDRLGTDEEAIFSALTGRPQSELSQIKDAYQRLTKSELEKDLRSELSGRDLKRAMILLAKGTLEPEDAIWAATAGLGTNEVLLFEALERITGDPARITSTIDAYRAKGYGEDMLADIRDDFSGREFDRALQLLHGTKTSACSTGERRAGLAAISQATALALRAVSVVSADLAQATLSKKVMAGLERHFNPGKAPQAITMAVASKARDVLSQSARELLSHQDVTCGTVAPMPCGPQGAKDPCEPNPQCETGYTGAWTCPTAGALVRLCPGFFICMKDRATGLLHEFVHHTGILDKFYLHQPGYQTLTPSGDGSQTDSLDNADSYARFAREIA